MPASLRRRPGCHLTTLFGNTAVPVVPAATGPAAPKKHGWLPLLTVLFLISYGLMTMLIVEQGATIESQRTLIRELFRDSAELSAMRRSAQQEKNVNVTEAQNHSQTPSAKTQSGVTQIPSTQIPSTQIPSTQAPSKQVVPSSQAPTSQTPSSQAVQQRRVQKQAQKPQFQMPSRPASDLQDDRRVLITS